MPKRTYSDVSIGKVEPSGAKCVELASVPCGLVIFGASGDLTARKLIPALFRLWKFQLLSRHFFILGTARTEMSHDAFREEMKKALEAESLFDGEDWEEFAAKIFYMPMAYGEKDSYRKLSSFLEQKARQSKTLDNRVFYLATPPSVFETIITGLGESGLSRQQNEGWSRIVIEKPYGRDLESARKLNRLAKKYFPEGSIFRIDHYLGKETVQNILMLRFANAIFEPVWNRRYIDHIQITSAETLGVEKRAGYYEEAGVLRDMFQNHMLQLLTLATLEPPSVYESEAVRDERVKVIKALRPIEIDKLDETLVIGQYGPGEIDGRKVPGYRGEQGVDRNSEVPTFAAMRLFVDNWRWQGVPFYLRSGKRLKQKFSEVVIQFKNVPHLMFEQTLPEDIGPNVLTLRIQPDERVLLKFHVKSPGSKVCLRDVVMDFPYTQGYKGIHLEAYERVLMDIMLGDEMLFVRDDGAELSWAYFTPLLNFIEDLKNPERPRLEKYKAGTWGPQKAGLLMGDKRRWVNYD